MWKIKKKKEEKRRKNNGNKHVFAIRHCKLE